MKLYIDANIFLDFFHLTSADLEELRKLEALIDEGKLILYLPQQTIDEISRNRDAKIADALDKFKKDKDAFRVNFPAFTKSMVEYEELRTLLNQANRKHSDLSQKALRAVEENNLDADRLINDLKSVAEKIPTSAEIFNKAISRFRIGNPPGKGKSSMGDEINWEALLATVPNGSDLYLVSGDRDYKSALNGGKVNGFLASEWQEVKKGQLFFFESLTDFFKTNFPDIKLAADVKNAGLIEKLAQSRSFATTHVVIGELQAQSAFTTDQVEQLLQVAEINNQVNWIIGDPDVKAFYKRLQTEYGQKISEQSKHTLDELLALTEEQNTEPEVEVGIPF